MDETTPATVQRQAAKACICYLWLLLSGGLCLILLGLVFAPVLPHFQLDAALTPEQLRDHATVQVALNVLQAAARGWPRLLCLAGLGVSVVSYLGLRAAYRATSDPCPK